MIAVLIGLITGVLGGLLGVGGGIILIPLLVLGLNMPQHLAQGVSLAVIIPTALSGLITFHRKGLIDYRMARLLAVGSICGILLSGAYVQLIPALMLKKIFGLFLALIGLKILLARKEVIFEEVNNQEKEDNDGKK